MKATPEEWRPVVGASDYQVSSQGRVRSFKQSSAGRLLTCTPKWGKPQYLCVTVEHEKRYVHDLVAAAFLGARPDDKPHIAHWDGDGNNNDVGNLRYATVQENCDDRYRHGTSAQQIGKLTPTQVAEIRERYGPHQRYRRGRETLRSLAVEYGVGWKQIGYIVRGEQWRPTPQSVGHIQGETVEAA
jgi:hypothetical protein